MANPYQVTLERDERGWWIASVPSVSGVHTQGRSIEQAVNRIREALALWVDDAEEAEFILDIHLPAASRAEVRRSIAARERADQAQQEASERLRGAVRRLSGEDLSVRDVAEVLALSPGRVQQIASEIGVRRVWPAERIAMSASAKKSTSTKGKTYSKKAASKKPSVASPGRGKRAK
jgi:predicted RNase H-like HicB family nuclease